LSVSKLAKGDELDSAKHKSATSKSESARDTLACAKESSAHASFLQPPIASVQTELTRLELRNDELARELADVKNERNRYSDLYVSTPIAYLAIDNKGLIYEINQLGCMLLGAGRDTIIHQPFTNFVHDVEAAFWGQFFKRAKRSGRQQSCELNIRRIDGKEFLASLESSHAEIGGISAICIVLADISHRKRKEKESLDWRNEMDELKKCK
jgi:PAS domain S-box-containing protein